MSIKHRAPIFYAVFGMADLRLMLFIVCGLISQQSIANTEVGFFNIGHMTNTKQAIDWAVKSGSNAIEVDMKFDDNGNPKKFNHGFPCDCSCNLFGNAKVCSYLGDDPCSASTLAADLLNYIAEKSQLALVIIDSKVKKLDKLELAGTNIIKYLDKELFDKGFAGNVLISVASVDMFDYLEFASSQAAVSDNSPRYYFSIDQNGDNTVQTINKLISLQPETSNRIYGTGVHTCSIFDNFYDAISLAKKNLNNGVVGSVYVWTIDDYSSMEKYIHKGAQGIITNNPPRLRKLLKNKGIKLFPPGGRIPTSINDNVIEVVN